MRITELLYIEKILTKFIEWLDEKKISENTILIITSDHGEELGEHGAFGHMGISNITHMYDELLKVPLIFYNPNLSSCKIDSINISLVDLLPTIADLIKKENSSSILYGVDGISISCFPEYNLKTRVLYSEASVFNKGKGYKFITTYEPRAIVVRIGPWKFIYYEKLKNKELYNTQKDPLEKENLADSYPDLVKEFHKLARLRLKSTRKITFK
jgi:arylsulfatase A-like enzyme